MPPKPLAVRVYVVVATGETDAEVPVTVPMPWSKLMDVALETAHDSTELPPGLTEAGLATSDEMTGAGAVGREVVKVKSGEEVLLLRASTEVTLKW
jgi:hypothetical protein